MVAKPCARCKTKPRKPRNSYCTEYRNFYRRTRHSPNERKRLKLKRQLRHYQLYLELKSQPCIDCKQTFEPELMEFDHVPERGKKCFTISRNKGGISTNTLRQEMAKCDVVCPNCHRLRTLKRTRERVTAGELGPQYWGYKQSMDLIEAKLSTLNPRALYGKQPSSS